MVLPRSIDGGCTATGGAGAVEVVVVEMPDRPPAIAKASVAERTDEMTNTHLLVLIHQNSGPLMVLDMT